MGYSIDDSVVLSDHCLYILDLEEDLTDDGIIFINWYINKNGLFEYEPSNLSLKVMKSFARGISPNQNTMSCFPIAFNWHSDLMTKLESIYFDFQISSDLSFSKIILKKTILGFETIVDEFDSAIYNEKLYWRVRPHAKDDLSCWSIARSFIITELIDSESIEPAMENLCLPVEVSWESIDGSGKYDLELISNTNSSIIKSWKVNENSLNIENSEDISSLKDSFHFRVRVSSADGIERLKTDGGLCWSDGSSFSLKKSIKSIVTDFKDGENCLISTFTWEDVDWTSNFIVEISDNEKFAPLINTFIVKDDHKYYYYNEEIEPNREYYWRVSIAGDNNSHYCFSNHLSFSKEPSIDLVFPDNNAEICVPTLFRWDLQEGAIHPSVYRIEMSQDANFNNIFYINNLLKENSYNFTREMLSSIDENDSYSLYWRIKLGKNGCWSPKRSFRIINPILLKDQKKILGSSLGVKFSWTNVYSSSPGKYEIQISEYSNFKNTIEDIKSIETSENTYSYNKNIKINDNKGYWWRVGRKLDNDICWSDNGVICYVKGEFDASPKDKEYICGRNVNFSWLKGDVGDNYSFRLSRKRNFIGKSVLKEIKNVKSGKVNVDIENISKDNILYWQVYKILNGERCYSPIWTLRKDVEISSPHSDQIICEDDFSFIWRGVHRNGFKIQVSRNKDFTDPVIDAVSDINEFNEDFTGLVGKYYWRVRINTVDECWSKSASFSIKESALRLDSSDNKFIYCVNGYRVQKMSQNDIEDIPINGRLTYELKNSDNEKIIEGNTYSIKKQYQLSIPSSSATLTHLKVKLSLNIPKVEDILSSNVCEYVYYYLLSDGNYFFIGEDHFVNKFIYDNAIILNYRHKKETKLTLIAFSYEEIYDDNFIFEPLYRSEHKIYNWEYDGIDNIPCFDISYYAKGVSIYTIIERNEDIIYRSIDHIKDEEYKNIIFHDKEDCFSGNYCVYQYAENISDKNDSVISLSIIAGNDFVEQDNKLDYCRHIRRENEYLIKDSISRKDNWVKELANSSKLCFVI